jgi:hypothetical protein
VTSWTPIQKGSTRTRWAGFRHRGVGVAHGEFAAGDGGHLEGDIGAGDRGLVGLHVGGAAFLRGDDDFAAEGGDEFAVVGHVGGSGADADAIGPGGAFGDPLADGFDLGGRGFGAGGGHGAGLHCGVEGAGVGIAGDDRLAGEQGVFGIDAEAGVVALGVMAGEAVLLHHRLDAGCKIDGGCRGKRQHAEENEGPH